MRQVRLRARHAAGTHRLRRLRAFRDLRALGTWIPTESGDPDLFACAATDGADAAVMVTHYSDADGAPPAFTPIS